jgi:hypothetical protein
MNLVAQNIKSLMVISGALTCTMIYGAFAPQAALQSTFGETLEGPLAEIIVRNWSVLITLIGGALLYGAFSPPARPLALTIASLSKLIFILLVLSQGTRYLTQQATIVIVIDAIWVVLFGSYLFGARLRTSNV